MKAVTPAGGIGIRLPEEMIGHATAMAGCGGEPILGHITQRNGDARRVALVDRGDAAATGCRSRYERNAIGGGTPYRAWGDATSGVGIGATVASHCRRGPLATLVAVRSADGHGVPQMRDDERVRASAEGSDGPGVSVNGGVLGLEPVAIDHSTGDRTTCEREPLEALARDGQSAAVRHHGFWQPTGTDPVNQVAESPWASGAAPWRARP